MSVVLTQCIELPDLFKPCNQEANAVEAVSSAKRLSADESHRRVWCRRLGTVPSAGRYACLPPENGIGADHR